MKRSNVSKFYSGRAPGDLPVVPNSDTETWLTDSVLILIFMEIIPDIAAFIIFLMFLTVMAVGISLLLKHVKMMYSRRATLKPSKLKRRRRVKRRKKIMDKEIQMQDYPLSSSEEETMPSQRRSSRYLREANIFEPPMTFENIVEVNETPVPIAGHQETHRHFRRYSHRPSYPTKAIVNFKHDHRGRKLPIGHRAHVTTAKKKEVGILTGTKRKTPTKDKHHRGTLHGAGHEGNMGHTTDNTPHMPKFLQRVHRTFAKHDSKKF